MALLDLPTQEYLQGMELGLLTMQEAWELENLHFLQGMPEDEWIVPPPRLQPVASRLWLMDQDCPARAQ